MTSVFEGVEKIVGRGGNAGYQQFLVFLPCFQTRVLQVKLKLEIIWYGVNEYNEGQLFHLSCLLFPKRQILDSFKLKEFADDNFKFDVNGRKFSKRVENTVGKGEIARHEQFLLFSRCFQKTCIVDTGKTRACLGNG